MSTFEIQVYKRGIWNVDSYFDDHDIALSEAERLDVSGKHAGVRILQENYDEKSNETTCCVVFSKTRQTEANQEWRVQAKRTSMVRSSAAKGGKASPNRRQSSPKKSNANLYIGLVVAIMVLIAGAAALIGLQEIAKYL